MTTTSVQQSGRGSAVSGLLGRLLPLVPFFLFLTIFLIVPTVTVAIGAFQDAETGAFTTANIRALSSDAALSALKGSLILSASTALIGAFLGALLSYLIVSAGPDSFLKRITLSISGVLSQFCGVVLPFARIATIGPVALITA